MSDQFERPVRDELRGRLMAREQQEDRRRDDLIVGQRLPVRLGLQQYASRSSRGSAFRSSTIPWR
jgi:hypothetical protein